MSYNGWSYNDWSYSDQSYNDCSCNEWAYSAQSYIDWSYDGPDIDEESFDESVLTPEQKLKVDDLLKRNHELTRRDLAAMIRLNLISQRASLDGREMTFNEIQEAHAFERIIDWTPPNQLDCTCNSTLEIDNFEEIPLPCIEKVVSSNVLLIDECLYLPCESQDKLDYSLVNSTILEIDFIFPSNAFDPPSNSNIKEHLRKYFTIVVTCFDEHVVLPSWTIVFLLEYIVYCENRRRDQRTTSSTV